MAKCKTCQQPILGLCCLNPKCGLLQPKVGPKTYDEFKQAINREVQKILGMRADDLPDYDYQRAWRENKRPIQVAKAAIKAAKNY